MSVIKSCIDPERTFLDTVLALALPSSSSNLLHYGRHVLLLDRMIKVADKLGDSRVNL